MKGVQLMLALYALAICLSGGSALSKATTQLQSAEVRSTTDSISSSSTQSLANARVFTVSASTKKKVKRGSTITAQADCPVGTEALKIQSCTSSSRNFNEPRSGIRRQRGSCTFKNTKGPKIIGRTSTVTVQVLCRENLPPPPPDPVSENPVQVRRPPVQCDKRAGSRKTGRIGKGDTSGFSLRCGRDLQGVPMVVVDYKCSEDSSFFRVEEIRMLQTGHNSYPNPTPVLSTGIECRVKRHKRLGLRSTTISASIMCQSQCQGDECVPRSTPGPTDCNIDAGTSGDIDEYLAAMKPVSSSCPSGKVVSSSFCDNMFGRKAPVDSRSRNPLVGKPSSSKPALSEHICLHNPATAQCPSSSPLFALEKSFVRLKCMDNKCPSL